MDKDNIMAIFVVVTVIVLSIFTISLMNQEPRTKVTVQYDCRLAEISVDYPQQVKEQCRKLLAPPVSYGEK